MDSYNEEENQMFKNLEFCDSCEPDYLQRTSLHNAVKNNQAEIVKLLVKDGANVNIKDSRGITPLLLAGSAIEKKTKSEIRKYDSIVQTLLSAKASANVVHPDTGIKPLHTASKLGCLKATEALLKIDPFPFDQCKKLRTVLHYAASAGNANILRKLLERFESYDLIDGQDTSKYTPSHVAAYEGHSECLQILIGNGGNLLAKTDKGHTVIDFILTKMPKPVTFLKNILSSNVTMENNTIHVNSAVLAPKEALKMEVVMSLITATTNMKQTILQHPLVELYLWIKWSKLKIYFHILLGVYVLQVLSLSGYSIMLRFEINFFPWNGILLGFSSCILLFYNLMQVLIDPRHYLKQLETWLSISFAGISLPISIGSFYHLSASSLITISEGNELYDDRQYLPQWILHFLSVAILLGYVQMMVLIGRFPQWGYYTLVFFTVLKNILVLFPLFLCLIVGFVLSFAVLFYGNVKFSNFWNLVVKTVVMMMGEYEYGDLFSKKNESSFLPVTSYIVFFIFMLASMILVNLMIGIAVNDIQGLKKKGHILQLEKQAEFVNHLERLASFDLATWQWFPIKLRKLGQYFPVTLRKLRQYFPVMLRKLRQYFPVMLRKSRQYFSTKFDFHRFNSSEVPQKLQKALLQLVLENLNKKSKNKSHDEDELMKFEDLLIQFKMHDYPITMKSKNEKNESELTCNIIY
ncbi:hypothetical protein QLX08_001534 [Tetragonisca angustula]|uniref:Ion transport domain-containing protein n=1 Tax=Tetragonisca angustula TaxID=166442 RepID=A0AAW1AFD1_9HYME